MDRFRVFYLDDDKDDIDLFLIATENFDNLQVIVFTDSDTMIKNLHLVKKIPNAVFIDLHMPRKSGFEVIKEIRIFDRYTDLPIVALSAIGFDNIDKSRAAGANYFIVKPVTIDKLRRTLRYVFDLDFKTFKPTKDNFALLDIDALG